MTNYSDKIDEETRIIFMQGVELGFILGELGNNLQAALAEAARVYDAPDENQLGKSEDERPREGSGVGETCRARSGGRMDPE